MSKNKNAKASRAGEVNWIKTFEPKLTEDLALHPKKQQELINWFKLLQSSKTNRILLLNGPSGSTKTTSLKVIAKEFNYDLLWYEVEGGEQEDPEGLTKDYFSNYKRQGDKFLEFLLKSSRFPSIFSQKERILCVKDLPNVFMRKGNEKEFWDILTKYKNSATSPLVFILTDTNFKSSNVAFNLFPDEIRNTLVMDTINFNPISITMMKKALNRICDVMSNKSEKFQVPSDKTLDSIITQSQGDMRNAINNLQFISQNGSSSLAMNTISVVKKGKAKKAAAAKISQGIGRDELLDVFHGVGRVLYPKREIDESTKRMKLVYKPEDVADAFHPQYGNFIELVHSNYIKNFGQIEDLSEFTNILSLSDIFQSEYVAADQISLLNLSMVVRGAMVFNENCPKGFRPISQYAAKQFGKIKVESSLTFEKQSGKYFDGHIIPKKDFFCDYNIFAKLIQK